MKQSTLSVVMIVKNEADKLAACLESIKNIADEIILLDSGSTDATESIGKRYGAKWYVNTDWQGFGKQRQMAQSYATCDYVLAIDADEVVNEKLRNGIAEVLQQPPQDDVVYILKRDNYFFNYPIYRYSWHKGRVARLYDRKKYQYSDHEVHESLDTQGAKTVTLAGYMEHYTNDSVVHFMKKNLRYSEDWARDKQGKSISLTMLLLKTLFTFVRLYFFKGGFLGGGYGLIHAIATANYTFNKYIILNEQSKNDN